MCRRLFINIIISGIFLFSTFSVLYNENISGAIILQKTIYVDDDNTAGPWNGTLEYPYRYIQDAIDVSSKDDTIYVFNGI